MAENKNSGLLKIALMIFAVVCIIYGIGYFFLPDTLVSMAGGEPVFHGWLRWSGGVLIALGVGGILVYLDPQNQGKFVTTLILGCILSALGLLWAWIKVEEGANVWFTALPTIILVVLAVLLWFGRVNAKEVLYPKKD